MEGDVYAFALSEQDVSPIPEQELFVFPNPVRGDRDNVKIHISGLPNAANIEVTFFSLAERIITTKTDAIALGEEKDIEWSLKNVANGVYFARVTIKYMGGGKKVKWLKIAVLRD